MKKAVWLFVLVGLAAFVAACAPPTHIQVQENFWQGTKGTIGIAIASIGAPDIYRGYGGDLSGLISEEASATGFRAAAKSVDLAPFLKIKNVFWEEIRKRGWEVKVFEDTLDLSSFVKVGDYAKKGLYFRDVRQIKERFGVDYLLLFEVPAFGGYQRVAQLFASSDLHALFKVRGDLISLADCRDLWISEMEIENAIVPLERSWNADADFSPLKQALLKGMENAIRYMKIEFNGGFK